MTKQVFIHPSCACCYVVRTNLGQSSVYGPTRASAMAKWRRQHAAWVATHAQPGDVEVVEKAYGQPRAVWVECAVCKDADA